MCPPTAPRTSSSQGGDSYLLSPATTTTDEQERLDAMHDDVTRFLGGRLTFAELGNPKRILEVGAGSGAWAVHAAKEYPDAQVIAIDISPLPERALPKNLKVLQMDVCQPMPFDDESFDVVHARFVLMHLPHFRDALTRICGLIKPGGHLILEEIDARTYSAHKEIPEEVEFFNDKIGDWAASRGETYDIGRELLPCLLELGIFVDVTVKVLGVPFSPGWDGPVEVGVLGDAMKQSLLKASSVLVKVVPDLTEESVAMWKLALEEPRHQLRLRMYFLAARKSVDLK